MMDSLILTSFPLAIGLRRCERGGLEAWRAFTPLAPDHEDDVDDDPLPDARWPVCNCK